MLKIALFFCFFSTCFGKYPVVFVPGDGGSQLEAKLNKTTVVHYLCDKRTNDFFSLWLNIELLVPVIIDCLIDNMRLVYNNVTRTTSSPPGVEIRVTGFGDSVSVEWLDPSKASEGAYFKDVANTLVGLGYDRVRMLRGAPYDFRKGPNENEYYFDKLKNLVEETYAANNNTKVALVAHSMGALMCLEMLHRQTQAWKDQHIRGLVTLAAVWGGSAKAIKVFAVGDNLGVWELRGNILKAEQITSPSLSWLLPSELFWKPDEVLVETAGKNYTMENLRDFFNDINYITGWEMYKDVHSYKENFSPPGVEVHCIHGYGVPTVERLIYKENTFPNSPSLYMGNGDGTVNIRSLAGCLPWGNQQPNPVYHIPFYGVDHMQILRSPKVMDYIRNLFEKW